MYNIIFILQYLSFLNIYIFFELLLNFYHKFLVLCKKKNVIDVDS
jgi:hypothetical protein